MTLPSSKCCIHTPTHDTIYHDTKRITIIRDGAPLAFRPRNHAPSQHIVALGRGAPHFLEFILHGDLPLTLPVTTAAGCSSNNNNSNDFPCLGVPNLYTTPQCQGSPGMARLSSAATSNNRKTHTPNISFKFSWSVIYSH